MGIRTFVNDQYTLPKLAYGYDDLEPWCSAETLHLHHLKHHAAYVAGANEATEELDAIDPNDTARLAGLQAALTFNLSGHVLHSLFWTSVSPRATRPHGPLQKKIASDFGSETRFHELLTATCMGVHGSGWGALSYDSLSGKLRIEGLHDHHHDMVPQSTLLAVVDVWEHAYYLGYHNDRAAWVDATVEHLDWPSIEARFATVATTLTVMA